MSTFYWWWLATGHPWRPIALGVVLATALGVVLWLRDRRRRMADDAWLRAEEERMARRYLDAIGHDRPLAERAAEARRLSKGAPVIRWPRDVDE